MRVMDTRYDKHGKPHLLVDEIPPLETLQFRKLPDDDGRGHLYAAEQDGYVRFVYQPGFARTRAWWQGDPEKIRLRLVDGTADTLVEPVTPDPGTRLDRLERRYFPELDPWPAAVATDPDELTLDIAHWRGEYITPRLLDTIPRPTVPMRVAGARYDRYERLQLLVNQIPALQTLEFDKLSAGSPDQPGHLYVAEQDGYVRFYYQDDHERGHGWGFDGRKFRLHLTDGTAETLVGPWSSNPATVNRHLQELDPGTS